MEGVSPSVNNVEMEFFAAEKVESAIDQEAVPASTMDTRTHAKTSACVIAADFPLHC